MKEKRNPEMISGEKTRARVRGGFSKQIGDRIKQRGRNVDHQRSKRESEQYARKREIKRRKSRRWTGEGDGFQKVKKEKTNTITLNFIYITSF